MSKETIVISLGGSIIIPAKIDINFLKKFRKLILGILKKYKKIIIVTGGGMIAREYQRAARQITKVSPTDLDWIGIEATRYNAGLVRTIFSKEAYSQVVEDPTKKIETNKKILIGCGWKPGCSSDKDAVLLAQNFNIKTVVNLSNIDFIYDKDPKKFKDAKPVETMTWKKFFEIIGKKWQPGMNAPFDPVAGKLAGKLGIKVVVMKGTNLANFTNFLKGKKFRGTVISS